MVDEARRRFLSNILTVAGLGTLSVGLGDLILDELSPGLTSPTGGGASTTSTSTAKNYLPDYLDFLQWLKGVSGPFASKPLKISLESEFTPLSLQRRDVDFFTFSGIDSQYSLKPYSLQFQDISLAVQTQSPTFDLFSVDNQDLGFFNKHLIPPAQLAEKYPNLTYPSLDLQEFDQFVWDRVAHYPSSGSIPGGGDTNNVFLLPLDMPLMVLFYRKDVYSKLGLTLPTTWSDYLDDLKTIQGSGLVPFATVCEAAPDISVVYEFLNHLASFGGTLWEVDGNNLTPVMNSDTAVAALENFVSLYPFAHPSSYTFSWGDVFNSLAHGAAATGLLWHDYINWINDPFRSTRAHQFGMNTNPAGAKGAFSTFGGAGVGVSKYGNNPELAWLWLQWATSKGTQETLLLDQNHVLPTRDSAVNSPDIASSIQGDAYAGAILAKSIFASGGAASLLGFPKWYQALDPLSTHLNRAWTGVETPRDALNLAQQRIAQLGSLTFA